MKTQQKNQTDWWKSILGSACLESESLEIQTIIQVLFGYHLVLLGDACFLRTLFRSPIQHKIFIPKYEHEVSPDATLFTRYDKWSIASDSIDVIYLAHILEDEINPHEILREAYRALRSEGHVTISSFNPWSLWGVIHRVLKGFGRSAWHYPLVSEARLRDWLNLLGFELVTTRQYFYQPPISNQWLLQKLSPINKWWRFFRIFGHASYILVARKKVLTVTPIKTKMHARLDPVVSGSVEPVRHEAPNRFPEQL